MDVSSRGVMYCMTLLKEKKEREILRRNISAVKLNLGEEGGASKSGSSQKGTKFLLVPFSLYVTYYWFPSRREPHSLNLK